MKTAMANFPANEPYPGDESQRLYNPYKELNLPGNVPYKTHFYIPKAPEYLFEEESLKKHRSWSETLMYYTGSAYLAGAATGGLAGVYSGLKEAELGESMKLRVNRVLNSSGQTGRRFGNRLGCLGMVFAGIESGVMHARGGNDDVLNSVLAGLGTGVLYRAAGGVRSAAIAGALGGIAAGSVVFGKNLVRRYVPI